MTTDQDRDFILAAERCDVEEMKRLWADGKGGIDLEARAVLESAINRAAGALISADISADKMPDLVDIANGNTETPYDVLPALIETGREDLISQMISAAKQKYQDSPGTYTDALIALDKRWSLIAELRRVEMSSLAAQLAGEIVEAKIAAGNARDYLRAAESGDLETVKAYLQSGKLDVDVRNADGETALYKAAVAGKLDVVNYLLKKGANPDHRTDRDYSPLSESAYQGSSKQVIRALIKGLKKHYKDNPLALYRALTFRDGGGYTMLKNARHGGVSDVIKPAIEEARRHVPTGKIVVVGCGFSGTMTAIELLRQNRDADESEPIEIVLIEKKEENRSAGLAYSPGTANDEHVINIQAERMSPFAHDPSDFQEWLYDKHRAIYRQRQDAVPRRLYQEYLDDRLQREINRNAGTISVVKKTAQVVDVEEKPDGAIVKLADGESIDAIHVALATGHTTAVRPAFLNAVQNHGRVLTSQWGDHARHFMDGMDRNGSVFIIGTSMSAFDAVVSLRKRGHEGNIVMISRNGLVHPTYEENRFPSPVTLDDPDFLLRKLRNLAQDEGQSSDPAYGGPSGDRLADAFGRVAGNLEEQQQTQRRRLSENEILDAFEREIRREWFALTRQHRYNGEQILTQWERHVPRVIETLTELGVSLEAIADRFHKYKSLIDVNRIGVSRAIGEVVNDTLLNGQAQIWTGSITGMEGAEDGVNVSYRMLAPDGTAVSNTRRFDYVISSLGQEMDYTKTEDELWKNLIQCGCARPHWTRMGIDVGYAGQLVNQNGQESDCITAIGTMRAGDTMVRSRRYGEKPGRGGRLGPPAFSVVAIKDHFGETVEHIWQQSREALDKKATASAAPAAGCSPA